MDWVMHNVPICSITYSSYAAVVTAVPQRWGNVFLLQRLDIYSNKESPQWEKKSHCFFLLQESFVLYN